MEGAQNPKILLYIRDDDDHEQVLTIGDKVKWRWKQGRTQRYMQQGFCFANQDAMGCTVGFNIDSCSIKMGALK